MAKRTTCSNCGRDAVVESVSRTASKVAFCERHQPANAVTSPSYRFISKGQAKTEDVELPEAQKEEAEATIMPASEEEPKLKGKRKSSKASTASKESDTSEDTGESAEGSGEAHSAS